MNANALELNTREIDAPKSLYASILDTIHGHEITFAQFMGGLNLRGEFHNIPINRGMSTGRYKLILDIKKTAMDLPKNVRTAATELVNDIYGPENDDPYGFYETEDFKAYINSPDYQAYRKKYAEEMSPIELMAKQRNYRADLKEAYPKMSPEEIEKRVQDASERLQYPDYDMERLNYNDYKSAEFYRRLDEIFESYIKR